MKLAAIPAVGLVDVVYTDLAFTVLEAPALRLNIEVTTTDLNTRK